VAVTRLWPGRTDRLIIAPHDCARDATRAAEIYAGRFVLAGKIRDLHGRSIFDLEPPSEDWEVALLASDGCGICGRPTPRLPAPMRARWSTTGFRIRCTDARSRRADVMARRVMSLLSQAPLVLGDTDGKFYRRYCVDCRGVRYLRYSMLDIPDGVPRLEC